VTFRVEKNKLGDPSDLFVAVVLRNLPVKWRIREIIDLLKKGVKEPVKAGRISWVQMIRETSRCDGYDLDHAVVNLMSISDAEKI
jgi:hypothetical protein